MGVVAQRKVFRRVKRESVPLQAKGIGAPYSAARTKVLNLRTASDCEPEGTKMRLLEALLFYGSSPNLRKQERCPGSSKKTRGLGRPPPPMRVPRHRRGGRGSGTGSPYFRVTSFLAPNGRLDLRQSLLVGVAPRGAVG